MKIKTKIFDGKGKKNFFFQSTGHCYLQLSDNLWIPRQKILLSFAANQSDTQFSTSLWESNLISAAQHMRVPARTGAKSGEYGRWVAASNVFDYTQNRLFFVLLCALCFCVHCHAAKLLCSVFWPIMFVFRSIIQIDHLLTVSTNDFATFQQLFVFLPNRSGFAVNVEGCPELARDIFRLEFSNWVNFSIPEAIRCKNIFSCAFEANFHKCFFRFIFVFIQFMLRSFSELLDFSHRF